MANKLISQKKTKKNDALESSLSGTSISWKKTFLSALGCVKEDWILERYLEMALDDKSGKEYKYIYIYIFNKLNTIDGSDFSLFFGIFLVSRHFGSYQQSKLDTVR